ncbi:hypothetical protein SOM12_18700 [Flavobacterium sp. CFBP9031]|uniref:hypothetical protein n=1 Tax=Flavobacterium sp. CFBP9031 TaxID=3096538 RepID=UPI002A6B5FC6|nr:hypothetical protein [Flavobacterium sp. CFBP9031]MDY0989468.1 hypothetical protein [Flavobacterium sp. CFBP9031]
MKRIIFTLLLIFSFINTFSQINEPLVIGGQQKGDPNATLEILSKNGTKGFMPPRLSQIQINALQTSLTADNNGLTVYNTDEKCLQSWKGDTWTECNPVLIAKFTFDCVNAKAVGNYYKATPVTNDEYLELPVIATKAGSYTFVAETQNGVRFFISSIISTASPTTQIIKIPAFGTPTSTGNFNYNLLDQSGSAVCTFPITVTENNAEFNINCSESEVIGDFNEGKQVTIKDQIILKVNVTKAGNYTFKTALKNGISFLSTGFFTYPGEQIVTLRPSGSPTWNSPDGIISFDILDKDGISYGCTINVPVTSAAAGFDIVNCTNDVTVEGDYSVGKQTTSLNYIELKLNVTKPGPYAIETEDKNGLSFRVSGTFEKTGLQTIQIPASGTPDIVGTIVFNQFKELVSGTILCPTVSVVVQDVIGCFAVVSSPTGNQIGTWTANVPLTGAQYSVTLTAISIGPYTLQATGSGITLSASGTIAAPGTQNMTITFNAAGIPETSGTVPLVIKGSCGDVTTINLTIGVGPGDQTNPGKSCKDILLATSNTAKDGEYWINPLTPGPSGAGSAYKTLCDMTGGGYTLIYSFSEDVNWNKYTWTGYVEYYGDYTNLNVSTYRTSSGSYSQNGYEYLTTGGVIKYDEFRIPTAHMLAINTGAGEYKLRVASNAGKGNIADARGNANYVTFSTVSGADPKVNATIARGVNGEGMIAGVPFTMTASANNTKGAGTYNGVSGHSFQLVQSTEAMRINWFGNPNVANANVWVNLFGYFDGDNDTNRGAQLNDHFQKCVNGANICKSDGNQVRTGNNYVMQYFLR